MIGGAHLEWGRSRSKIMSKFSLTASLDCHTSYFYHIHVSPSTHEFPLRNSQKKKRQEWSQMHQSAMLVQLEMDCCHIIAPFVGDLERWSDKMILNSLLDQPSAWPVNRVARISGMKNMHGPNDEGSCHHGQLSYSYFWVASVLLAETEAMPCTQSHHLRCHPTPYQMASPLYLMFSTLEGTIIIIHTTSETRFGCWVAFPA